MFTVLLVALPALKQGGQRSRRLSDRCASRHVVAELALHAAEARAARAVEVVRAAVAVRVVRAQSAVGFQDAAEEPDAVAAAVLRDVPSAVAVAAPGCFADALEA